MFGLKSKLAAMRAAPTPINSLLEAIDDHREVIASLRAEREKVSRAPRPAAEILDALDAHLDKLATDAVDGLNLNSMTNRANPLALRLPFRTDRERATIDSSAACSVLLGLIIATSRPAIRSIIQGQLQDLTRGKEGMSDEALTARLAEIDREILSAELAEESAIRSLEVAGVTVLRRPDLDPRAALADDSALLSM
jgi:hypothetical protein